MTVEQLFDKWSLGCNFSRNDKSEDRYYEKSTPNGKLKTFTGRCNNCQHNTLSIMDDVSKKTNCELLAVLGDKFSVVDGICGCDLQKEVDHSGWR